ncbi:conserved hypothetical protein [Ricinus communis]|uniref:Uncharacterized protein n=1 Tax=Ricinus communis TaxID=3988 RepID=B9RHM5_RICCO|nr:conserved hypothetical protein [Ricinus communis]
MDLVRIEPAGHRFGPKTLKKTVSFEEGRRTTATLHEEMTVVADGGKTTSDSEMMCRRQPALSDMEELSLLAKSEDHKTALTMKEPNREEIEMRKK